MLLILLDSQNCYNPKLSFYNPCKDPQRKGSRQRNGFLKESRPFGESMRLCASFLPMQFSACLVHIRFPFLFHIWGTSSLFLPFQIHIYLAALSIYNVLNAGKGYNFWALIIRWQAFSATAPYRGCCFAGSAGHTRKRGLRPLC